jgi:hypothetical protein
MGIALALIVEERSSSTMPANIRKKRAPNARSAFHQVPRAARFCVMRRF